MTTLSFNCSQTFYIDPTFVQNAPSIQISAVDLYFLSKPLVGGSYNNSGLGYPGVTVYLYPTIFGVPKLDPTIINNYARLEYLNITTSSDGSAASKFRFISPISVATGQDYAIVVCFDQNASYVLWKSVEGEHLVGTNIISPGASGRNIGHYYEYINSNPFDDSNTDQFLNQDQYLSHWKPLNDTDLKFTMYTARFTSNGSSVSSLSLPVDTQLITYNPLGTTVTQANNNFIIPSSKTEFMTFDQTLSIKEKFVGGQWAYQDTFSYPGGNYGTIQASKIAVTANTTLVTAANNLFPNGANFNWNTVFPNFAANTNDVRFVIKDTTKVNVRKIGSILSNTVLQVTEPITFSNALAEFLVTPIGMVDGFNKSSPFGTSQSIILLTNSAANSTVKFVNNMIQSIAVTAGGTSYTNSDVIYINGFENVAGEVTGGFKATGNLVTNSTGGITSIYFSNSGCGYVNTAAITYVVANSTSGNSTGNTSPGSGATFVPSIGATIRTEDRANNYFRGVSVINVPISDIVPYFEINNPPGTDYQMLLTAKYQRLASANTFSGYKYLINTAYANAAIDLVMFQKNATIIDFLPAFMSYSNEFVTLYANGAVNDTVNSRYSNGIILTLACTSNNDFVTTSVNSAPVLMLSKYIINADGSNEITDTGNAWAKGLSNKVNFARTAEDLRVYTTSYRPANTDIQMYARIYNNLDTEAWDDKDWTRLELKDGQNITSSSIDKNDFVELTFGFKQVPNSQFTLAGAVSVVNNSANLIGIGSSFSTNVTANVAVNDLVKIYSPLFPNVNIVAVVTAVANDTQISINKPITNNSFLGTTLLIDKVTNKHQAFNNIMNNNVSRYYNTSMIEYDGYDVIAIKTVFLSDNPNKIPRNGDMRLIGVSA